MVNDKNEGVLGEDREILGNRKTVIDRLEDEADEEDSVRPMREAFESATDNIPEGPLGKLGDGDALGIAGYYAISTGQLAVLPIPGVKQPGYHVISHGVSEYDSYERHTVNIAAASQHVARVAAEYEVASPSNIDYVTGEVDTVSIEEKKQRATASTWEIVVDVADRGQKEM